MKKIGIQGGKGSFNEEALVVLVKQHHMADFSVVYCYNTETVLEQLRAGEIDCGVFAIYNSQSLLVDETAAVMGKYLYDVIDYVTIPVRHCLMTVPGVEFAACTAIMGHKEAIVQCEQNLSRYQNTHEIVPGTGTYMDGAAIAEGVAAGKISQKTAILGSRAIAHAFDLTIVQENMEDNPHNTTTFLFVKVLTK